jgi:transposase family protein
MGVATQPVTRDLDVPGTTFSCPDLTTFQRPDVLGLIVVGQYLALG